MSILRRYPNVGHPIFVTMVTFDRAPVLMPMSSMVLRKLSRLETEGAWELNAWVVLPEHLHLLVLPRTTEISTLIHRFKMAIGSGLRTRIGHSFGRLWQHRFFDHIIRNEEDMNRHIDYIHYNPVKHKRAISPGEYELSSFNLYLADGNYEPDWGSVEALDGKDFGE